MIELWVAGKPRGKDRPRFHRKSGRVFTTKETIDAEQSIVDAWIAAGSPVMNDEPLSISLQIQVTRPASHYKKNGELSAEGLRNPMPMKQKPDVDNCLKLVMDALNKRAYADDVRVVHAVVHRVWSDQQGILIGIESTTNG